MCCNDVGSARSIKSGDSLSIETISETTSRGRNAARDAPETYSQAIRDVFVMGTP
jgi:hypothetical protein